MYCSDTIAWCPWLPYIYIHTNVACVDKVVVKGKYSDFMCSYNNDVGLTKYTCCTSDTVKSEVVVNLMRRCINVAIITYIKQDSRCLLTSSSEINTCINLYVHNMFYSYKYKGKNIFIIINGSILLSDTIFWLFISLFICDI